MLQERHAYLIMAHNNLSQLKKLLMLLDDERNDLFVHMDRRAEFGENDLRLLNQSVKKAHLQWTKRIRVTWGGYSMVKAELILLKAAVKTPHAYYHLLSGNDLPLKTQEEIHSCFSRTPGAEYIEFSSAESQEWAKKERIGEYHFFQEFIGRKVGRVPGALRYADRVLTKCQRKLKICRLKQPGTICKGGNWFSITNNLALHVISEEKRWKKMFRFGICVDEFLIQTAVMNSPYKDNVVTDNKRLIDWTRGQPYTWRMEDCGELMNSSAFWARKFDEKTDCRIIDAIFDALYQV